MTDPARLRDDLRRVQADLDLLRQLEAAHERRQRALARDAEMLQELRRELPQLRDHILDRLARESRPRRW